MFSLLKGATPEETFDFGHGTNNFLNDLLIGNVRAEDVILNCKDRDILEIFKITHEIDSELKYLHLENMVFENFLEANDPKMLLGLTDEEIAAGLIRTSAIKVQPSKHKNVSVATAFAARGIQSNITTSFTKKSSVGGDAMKNTKDFRLNYKTKVELADRLAKQKKVNVKQFEVQMCLEAKKIQATLEEVIYELKEVGDCLDCFDRNVVILGRDPDTGHTCAEKFASFCNHFYHTGMGLVAKLRITSNNHNQEIISLRNKVTSKKEMGGLISAADFDLMLIKKLKETKTLETNMNTLDFIKSYHGKVSYTLAVRRKELIELEVEMKKMLDKTEFLRKQIASFEKKFDYVQGEVHDAQENLRTIKKKMNNYKAPKIIDYISLKEKLISLEKEKKKMDRDIYLLKIHLKNAIQKSKKSK